MSGRETFGELVGDDPMVRATQAAVEATSVLVPPIADVDAEVAADLVASLAVLECLAAEAACERGRVRRKLCDLACRKAARSQAALDIATACRVLGADEVAAARRALDAAIAAISPPQRMPAWDVLRRW